jgi:cell division protein FtsL
VNTDPPRPNRVSLASVIASSSSATHVIAVEHDERIAPAQLEDALLDRKRSWSARAVCGQFPAS